MHNCDKAFFFVWVDLTEVFDLYRFSRDRKLQAKQFLLTDIPISLIIYRCSLIRTAVEGSLVCQS